VAKNVAIFEDYVMVKCHRLKSSGLLLPTGGYTIMIAYLSENKKAIHSLRNQRFLREFIHH
jgi:hypothetical protein